MRQRIKGEPSGEAGGGVAERVGRIAVRHFVRDDGED